MKKIYLLTLINLIYCFSVTAQWVNVSFNKPDERANYSTIKIASKQMVAVSEDYNSVTEFFPVYSYLSSNKTKSWTRVSTQLPSILGGALYPFSTDTWVSVVF